MPVLIVETGPAAGQSFSFATRAVVGRGEIADVRIDEPTLSRRHCEIRPGPEGWEIADLGSANGTSLNGQRLNDAAPLRRDDRIEVGKVKLRFEVAANTDPGAMSSGLTQPDVAPSALFTDVLARIKLFCELGALPAASEPGDQQLSKALAAIRAAFPRIDHAAVLLHVSTGDRFTVSAMTSAGEGPLNLIAIAPRAREATRHERGFVSAGGSSGAWAAMPIRYAGEMVGVLYIAADTDAGALRGGDRDTLFAVAGLLGVLLAPQRKPAQSDTVRDDRDLALARRIQQRFLPQSAPDLPGYRVVDSYTAARVIGGDHFDYLKLADGRVAIIVADVSGKAVSGALYMARLGLHLASAAPGARDLPSLLRAVNAALYAELEAGMFVTLLAVAIGPDALELASAGHPPPLLRAANGVVTTVDMSRGPPIGAVAEPVFERSTVSMSPGDLLLLYTDGLDEAHDPRQQLFGNDRIVESLRKTPDARGAIDGLLAALGEFVRDEPQSDDLTMVVVQRE